LQQPSSKTWAEKTKTHFLINWIFIVKQNVCKSQVPKTMMPPSFGSHVSHLQCSVGEHNNNEKVIW